VGRGTGSGGAACLSSPRRQVRVAQVSDPVTPRRAAAFDPSFVRWLRPRSDRKAMRLASNRPYASLGPARRDSAEELDVANSAHETELVVACTPESCSYAAYTEEAHERPPGRSACTPNRGLVMASERVHREAGPRHYCGCTGTAAPMRPCATSAARSATSCSRGTSGWRAHRAPARWIMPTTPCAHVVAGRASRS
jgi:hypothetical protein